MATAAQLALLKVDLGIKSPDTDQTAYLNSVLDGAIDYLAGKGITVGTGDEDNLLVSILAGWMYRSRAAGVPVPMPVFAEQTIKNRICKKAMTVST